MGDPLRKVHLVLVLIMRLRGDDILEASTQDSRVCNINVGSSTHHRIRINRTMDVALVLAVI